MPSILPPAAAVVALAIVVPVAYRGVPQPSANLGAEAVTASHPAGPAVSSPSLEDLGFLAGAWEHDEEGLLMREVWDAPRGDAMIGHFMIVNRGTAALYELFVVEQDEGAPVLRLRHFNRGLVPWESEQEGPLALTLVDVTDNRAVFENPEIEFPRQIVYEVEGDTLVATLHPAPAAKRAKSVLTFVRVPDRENNPD